MRHFIFITPEGTTFQPNSDFTDPEVDNCQVLGFEEGIDEKDAFVRFLKVNSWLRKSSFAEVFVYELKDKEPLTAFNILNSNRA
jgi:hypothetical protein